MKNSIFTILLLIGFATASYAQNSNAALTKGYRGMVEIGFCMSGTEDKMVCEGPMFYWHADISTTHGYQFNPYLFLGGGMGFHSYNE